MGINKSGKRVWLRRFGAALLLLVLAAVAAVVTINHIDVAPRVLAPYLSARAEGHSGFFTGVAERMSSMLLSADRTTLVRMLDDYPDWAGAAARDPQPAIVTHRPRGAEELRSTIANARPGDHIEIQPGEYYFPDAPIAVNNAGGEGLPIVVSAPRLGDVTLKMDLVEGFNVRAPYWRFENLVIEGVCRDDSACEHAFHIVGGASQTVLRNNVIRDFNAQIKINGENGVFPDAGLLEGNTLVNTRPRRTANPVTPIDLVAANNWMIRRNLIADFIKAGGDDISYGAFVKGAGRANRIEANVVLCAYRLQNAGGRQVGLSLGGGGTTPEACRDGQCAYEQQEGVLSNNLVAFCSDDGIYLNRAAASMVLHNTILDTAGVTARGEVTTTVIAGNLLDGVMRNMEGATVRDEGNRTSRRAYAYFGYHPVRNLFRDAFVLDLRWSTDPPTGATITADELDLCNRSRPAAPVFGAFRDITECFIR